MRIRLALAPLWALACLVAGCASHQAALADPPARATPDWRAIITDDDKTRLREWRTAWTRALTKARASGHALEIASEGALLDPDIAIAWSDPPPGSYRCRTIKIGAQAQDMLDYVAYPAFDCRLRSEDGTLSLVKLNGSQRPIGLLLPYAANRMLFLGTLQLGDETRSLEYGRDRERDLAAIVDRVGDRRWRLSFPYPHFESTIDVMELTPAPGG
jgi:hypothetical protein